MPSISLQQTAWLLVLLVVAACSGAQESTPSPTQPGSTTTEIAPSTTLITAPPTTEPAVSTSTVQGPIETRSVDHDGDPSTSLTAEFTITEPGWLRLVGTYKSGPGGYVAVKFLAVTQVASAACDSTVWIPVGETAEDLASALAEIEDFLTKEALNTVSAYGYDGYHLVLAIPENGFGGCDDGNFDGYEGPTFSRYYQGPGQVVEFWVLDVEGTPLLIEATWFPDSPAEDLAQLQAILDSIVIRP